MATHTLPKRGYLSRHNRAFIKNLICDLNGISDSNTSLRREYKEKINKVADEVIETHKLSTETVIYEITRRRCINQFVK